MLKITLIVIGVLWLLGILVFIYEIIHAPERED